MNRIACALGCVVLGSLACAPVHVETAAEPGVELSQYETFYTAQAERTSAEPSDPADLLEWLRREVGAALEDRGYRSGSEKDSDLRVEIHLASETDVRRVNAGDPDTDYTVPEEFDDARLVIDLFDTRTGSSVWRGSGETEIQTSGSLIPEGRKRVLARAVREILAELPARSSDTF